MKVPWFALLILAAALLLGTLVGIEGFTGTVSAAETAAMEARLAALEPAYEHGKNANASASDKPPPSLGDLVNKPGALGINDSVGRPFVDSLLPGLSSGLSPEQMAALQSILMKQVPATQTTLSTADASQTSSSLNMPTASALSQGATYKQNRTANGNAAPTPTNTYDDECAAAASSTQENPVAVQVGKYPFPTGYEDKGCDKNCC